MRMLRFVMFSVVAVFGAVILTGCGRMEVNAIPNPTSATAPKPAAAEEPEKVGDGETAPPLTITPSGTEPSPAVTIDPPASNDEPEISTERRSNKT